MYALSPSRGRIGLDGSLRGIRQVLDTTDIAALPSSSIARSSATIAGGRVRIHKAMSTATQQTIRPTPTMVMIRRIRPL